MYVIRRRKNSFRMQIDGLHGTMIKYQTNEKNLEPALWIYLASGRKNKLRKRRLSVRSHTVEVVESDHVHLRSSLYNSRRKIEWELVSNLLHLTILTSLFSYIYIHLNMVLGLLFIAWTILPINWCLCLIQISNFGLLKRGRKIIIESWLGPVQFVSIYILILHLGRTFEIWRMNRIK